MGLVGALGLLPALLLGLPSGALADRLDKRRLLAWADSGRAVLTAVIPAAIWLDASPIVVILVVTVPVSGLRALFDSAFSSAIPPLVGRENLGRATSYIETVLSVPFLIGPGVAGVLLVVAGPAWTLAIDAASFGVSAVSLLFLRRQLRVEGMGDGTRLLSDIVEGIRFVRQHRALLVLIGYWSCIAVATAGILPALSYYVTVDLSFGAHLFGFVGSAWSAGYLFGSLVGGRLGNRLLGLRLVGAGTIIGLALLAMSMLGNPAGLLAAGFLVGVALALQLVAYVTLRASLTPDRLLGRVGSTARTLSLGLQPLGMLGAGFVIEAASGRAALVAMGSLALAVSALFAVSRALRFDGQPSPE